MAVPEAERGLGAAALKPTGVLSWGSTLPPHDSKQGPRGVGMISGTQPVVFSTTSCRRRKKQVEVEDPLHLVSFPWTSLGHPLSAQPHRLTGRLWSHPNLELPQPNCLLLQLLHPSPVFLPAETSLTLLRSWLLPTPSRTPASLA